LIGPTEVRLILIALNTALALHLGLDFSIGHLNMAVFDLVGLGVAGTMIAPLIGRVIRNLGDLGGREPGASRRIKPRNRRRSSIDSPAA
jgi:hypothetical protein